MDKVTKKDLKLVKSTKDQGSREVIERFEDLLRKARSGDITSFAVVVSGPSYPVQFFRSGLINTNISLGLDLVKKDLLDQVEDQLTYAD